MSLKKQAVSGLIWTFLQQFGTQAINFVVGIILARILLPSDFGTIALFGVLMGIAMVFVESGMTASLIRTKEVDERDLSTIFWFNLGVSILMYLLIFLIAPWVARFFDVAILTPIIRVYSLILLINGFTTVQRTRFVKEMDFKTSFKIKLPSLVLGGIAGVLMAYFGMGIWTLVYYPIIQSLLSSLQFWFYSKWRPSFTFDKDKFNYHFNYGFKLMLSSLLDIVFQNVYTIIIGKFFSPVQLGYYNRADSLKQLPVSNLAKALNQVTFPLFATISSNNIKLKEVYQKLMRVVIYVVAPVLCLLIVIAEPMIRFLLTEKWLPAVPYFQILAVAGILYPIHSYNLNVLKVKGRTDLFLKLEIWKKILIVIVVLATFRFGILGLVWGQVIISMISFFINSYFTGKTLGYGSLEQIGDLIPTLLVAGFTGLIAYSLDINFFYKLHDLFRIIIMSSFFGITFIGISFAFKFKEIGYLKELLMK
jgi:O-antigen/teichoic acid export membrane protein